MLFSLFSQKITEITLQYPTLIQVEQPPIDRYMTQVRSLSMDNTHQMGNVNPSFQSIIICEKPIIGERYESLNGRIDG